MKRIIASLAAVTLMAGAAPAFAGEVYAPTGTITLAGNLHVNQAVSGTCAVSFTLSNDGTSASITNGTFSGDFPCTSISPSNFPWAVSVIATDSANNATKLRIHDLYATSSTGYCNGDVDVDWNNATGHATFVNASVPGVIGWVFPAACTLNGTLDSSPDATVHKY